MVYIYSFSTNDIGTKTIYINLSSLQIYGIERMGTKYERNRVKCSYLIWNEPYQVILIANGLYI